MRGRAQACTAPLHTSPTGNRWSCPQGLLEGLCGRQDQRFSSEPACGPHRPVLTTSSAQSEDGVGLQLCGALTLVPLGSGALLRKPRPCCRQWPCGPFTHRTGGSTGLLEGEDLCLTPQTGQGPMFPSVPTEPWTAFGHGNTHTPARTGLALTGWLAWPLASQEDHLHLLLPWSWNQHQAQRSDRPQLLVPGGEGGAGRGGCGAGDRGLWSAVSPVCAAQRSGWWARERQSHLSHVPGRPALGGPFRCSVRPPSDLAWFSTSLASRLGGFCGEQSVGRLCVSEAGIPGGQGQFLVHQTFTWKCSVKTTRVD